jgi:hypothetical protein
MGWQTINAVVLHAGNTIVNPGGVFVYDPSPGAGNLVASMAPLAVNDGLGNLAVPGVTNYGVIGGTLFAVSLQGSLVVWYTAPSEAGPWSSVGDLEALTTGGGTLFLNFANVQVSGLTVSTINGSANTGTAGLTDGTIAGSSSNAGLPNGGINGTSGGASAGTAHTHGGGSYAVISGQHSHASGSYAVNNGTHAHAI